MLQSQIVGAIMAGVEVYNETLRTMAYSVESGNDKFFDLALDMYRFMPIAMAYGATGYTPNALANAMGVFVSSLANRAGTKYLMDPLGTAATPFVAMMAFTLWTEASIWRIGLTDEEMDEFNRWNQPIAYDYYQ